MASALETLLSGCASISRGCRPRIAGRSALVSGYACEHGDGFDFVGTPRLNLEEWAALLRSTCGGDHEVIDPNAFAGWRRRVSVYGVAAAPLKIQCGLAAVDHGGNTYRFERTRRDVRLADADFYCASFQVAGRSAVTQNEQTVQLADGDIGLVEGARPSTRLSDNGSQWLSIYLRASRSFLISDSSRRLAYAGAAERSQHASSVSSFSTASETKNPQPRRPAPTCGSPSTICLAHYLRRLIRDRSLVMPTGCSPASAAS